MRYGRKRRKKNIEGGNLKSSNIVKNKIYIQEIPAIIWGKPRENLYLYIHGQKGCKEDAEVFSEIVCRHGWQVLSIDLPEHGERQNENNSFDPWHITPELSMIMEYAKQHWRHISLFANSIGAWFSMLSYGNERLKNCMFLSPILDMKQLISDMMRWENVSEDRLKRERVITTSFGQTISWDYLEYALTHPIMNWQAPTQILYGENDNMTGRDKVEQFVHRFDCDLTVLKDGEHWFHTPQQMEILCRWVKKNLNREPKEKDR